MGLSGTGWEIYPALGRLNRVAEFESCAGTHELMRAPWDEKNFCCRRCGLLFNSKIVESREEREQKERESDSRARNLGWDYAPETLEEWNRRNPLD